MRPLKVLYAPVPQVEASPAKEKHFRGETLSHLEQSTYLVVVSYGMIYQEK
jgi:hypothetical protein